MLGTSLVTDGPCPHPTQGRFTIAAKHHISIAEIYETELVDIEKVRGSREALPGCRGSTAAAGPLGPGLVSAGGGLRCLGARKGAWGVGRARVRQGLLLCPRQGRARGGQRLHRFPVSPQAIAHYEQSADYYKGEESNRYQAAGSPRPPQPPGSSSPPTATATATDFCLCPRPAQLSQQVSAEGGWLRGSAGAVSEGH